MKKVLGIISIVLSVIISFQSCAVGLGNTLTNSKEVSGSAGIMLAVCIIIAGIIALISKFSKGMTITSLVFYAIGGLFGICNMGTYSDLGVWSVISFIFAALIVIDLIRNKDKYNKKIDNKPNTPNVNQ